MDVSFATSKLQKLCNNSKKMVSELGPRDAERLQQRLLEMRRVETLRELELLPATGCHPLKGNRRGEWAVYLAHPRRLIFLPDHEPLPVLSDGGLDTSRVTRVVIIEVGVDYH